MVTNLAESAEPTDAVGELYATVSGQGAPVLLLHGLFGMGSNLGAVARALSEHFEVHQLDLPNHGRSPWRSKTTLSDLADAVASYMANSLEGPAALLGHSLGGKVAMQLALKHPARVLALVVADIAPVAYPPSHDAVFAAIAAVAAAAPASRQAAAELMRKHLSEEGVVQFLSLSLARDHAGAYRWRFNAQALLDNYGEFRAAPEGGPYSGPTLFISGAESSYVTAAGVSAAKTFFPRAEFLAIEGTGHWLHAEKPRPFNAAVDAFLRAQLPGETP